MIVTNNIVFAIFQIPVFDYRVSFRYARRVIPIFNFFTIYLCHHHVSYGANVPYSIAVTIVAFVQESTLYVGFAVTFLTKKRISIR